MPSFKPVTSFLRGLDILRVLNSERQSSVGSLHRATGLDKATIVRMLETLEHAGYVTRDADRSSYLPTGACLLLSQGYDQHMWIGGVAEPIMHELRKQISWPSDVAIFDRDSMISAQTTREPGSMLFDRRPGFRFPMLSTALGRAYLGFSPPEQQKQIISTLAAIPGQWTEMARHPKQLARLLEDVHKRGFAVTDEKYGHHIYDGRIWAIAVPVCSSGNVFASISIMMLRDAVTLSYAVENILPPLQLAAREIGAALTEKLRRPSWTPKKSRVPR